MIRKYGMSKAWAIALGFALLAGLTCSKADAGWGHRGLFGGGYSSFGYGGGYGLGYGYGGYGYGGYGLSSYGYGGYGLGSYGYSRFGGGYGSYGLGSYGLGSYGFGGYGLGNYGYSRVGLRSYGFGGLGRVRGFGYSSYYSPVSYGYGYSPYSYGSYGYGGYGYGGYGLGTISYYRTTYYPSYSSYYSSGYGNGYGYGSSYYPVNNTYYYNSGYSYPSYSTGYSYGSNYGIYGGGYGTISGHGVGCCYYGANNATSTNVGTYSQPLESVSYNTIAATQESYASPGTVIEGDIVQGPVSEMVHGPAMQAPVIAGPTLAEPVTNSIVAHEMPSDQLGMTIPTAPLELEIQVPADAKVTINGYVTTSTGTTRKFETAPVSIDGEYTFEIVTEVTRDGKLLTRKQSIDARSGTANMIAFNDFPAAPNTSAIAADDSANDAEEVVGEETTEVAKEESNEEKSATVKVSKPVIEKPEEAGEEEASKEENPETTLTLIVPADAKLLLGGNEIESEGEVRIFQTNELSKGDAWKKYQIEVISGEESQKKTISLKAGESKSITFEFEDKVATN